MSNNNEPFSLFVSKLNFLAVSAGEDSITMEEFIVKYPDLEKTVRELDRLIQYIANPTKYKSFGAMEVQEGYFNWWVLTFGGGVLAGVAAIALYLYNIKKCEGLINEFGRLIDLLGLSEEGRGRGIGGGIVDGRGWIRRLQNPDSDAANAVRKKLIEIRNKGCFKANETKLKERVSKIRTVEPNGDRRLVPGINDWTRVKMAETALVLISAWIATEAMFLWEVILQIPGSWSLSPDWLNSFSMYVVETADGVVPEAVINVIAGAGELIAPHQGVIVGVAATVLLLAPAMAGGIVVAPGAAVGVALGYLFGWGLAAGAITIGGG